MRSLRSSSERLGPSSERGGGTDVIGTGVFSSRAGATTGELASTVSIAASTVVIGRTQSLPPASWFKRMAAGSRPQRHVGEVLAQLVDRGEDLRRAGLRQLLLGEPAREHADRAHARALGGAAIPCRVADHHGVARLGAGLLQRG